MRKPSRREHERFPALLDAIAARRGQWDELHRAKTPPSKREKELLGLLESDRECSRAWSLMAREVSAWPTVHDHAEVLRLLIKSADIADDPQAAPHAEAAVASRFEELKAACDLLIDYNLAQIGLYDGEMDLDEPLDDSRPWPFKWAYLLSWMLDGIICEENLLVGQAMWTPGRPIAVGDNAEARMFEHVFSSLLRKAFRRPCDEFVMSLSRQIYPAAAALESNGVMMKFRRLERERHRRMLDGFSGAADGEDDGHPVSGSRVVDDE